MGPKIINTLSSKNVVPINTSNLNTFSKPTQRLFYNESAVVYQPSLETIKPGDVLIGKLYFSNYENVLFQKFHNFQNVKVLSSYKNTTHFKNFLNGSRLHLSRLSVLSDHFVIGYVVVDKISNVKYLVCSNITCSPHRIYNAFQESGEPDFSTIPKRIVIQGDSEGCFGLKNGILIEQLGVDKIFIFTYNGGFKFKNILTEPQEVEILGGSENIKKILKYGAVQFNNSKFRQFTDNIDVTYSMESQFLPKLIGKSQYEFRSLGLIVDYPYLQYLLNEKKGSIPLNSGNPSLKPGVILGPEEL